MSSSFKRLKARSKSGEALEFLRSVIRYDLGTHKRTRLRQAGVLKAVSLLWDSVSKEHARRLTTELQARARKVGRSASKRFRFLTILHSVDNVDIADVRVSVRSMETRYRKVLSKLQLWSRGTIELEIVNLTILRQIAGSTDGEARKLNVLSGLTVANELRKALAPRCGDDTKVLVHLHTVVDLGDDPSGSEVRLRELLGRVSAWTRTPYQIELKSLFKERPITRNLKGIAAYVTKGGNERLRYNAAFGRDLGQDLDAKIWRAGLGRADKGEETVEDERGLTVGEVKKLDDLYLWLMKRRSGNRGYILSSP